ncbi:hypothetical protein [Arthrobacter sp. C152]
MTSGKALALGGTLFTAGAGISASFGVMNMQARESFWSLPVLVGAALAVLGLVFLIIGTFVHESPNSPSLTMLRQRGGNDSRNFQAGGNMSITNEDKA